MKRGIGLFLVLCCVALFLLTTRESYVESAVAHGTNATKPYPWFCTLEAMVNGTWVVGCGGTLIAPRVVVTAGHCPLYFLAYNGPKRVCVGRRYMHDDTGVEFHSLKAAYMYQKDVKGPGDLGKLHDDVSVLILNKDSSHTPALLADASFVPKGPLKIIGFGVTDAKTSTNPAVLQEAVVALHPCEGRQDASDKLLCVLKYTTGATGCHGDSGGPLFAESPAGRAIVLGATSKATQGSAGICGNGQPAAWTDLRLYARWIKSFIDSPHTPRGSIALVAPNPETPKPFKHPNHTSTH